MDGRHSLSTDDLHQGHSGVAAGGYAGARRLSSTNYSDAFPAVIVPPVSTSNQTQLTHIGSPPPGAGVRRNAGDSAVAIPSLEPLEPPPGLESLTGDKNQPMAVTLSTIAGTEEQTTGVSTAELEERPITEELREQDRFLPIANVSRIMKRCIPQNGKIAKDAKECMQECVSEFISFITSEASERCQQEKRKTINGEDIIFAMTTLGFDNYLEPLKLFLQKYRENIRGTYPKDQVTLVDGSEDMSVGGGQDPKTQEITYGVHQLTGSLPQTVYSYQSQPSGSGTGGLAGQVISSLNVEGTQSMIPQSQVPLLQ